jgi:outer membrane protein assembly factor BamB
MNDLKKLFWTNIFIIGLIVLHSSLLNTRIAAQQVARTVESSETIDLTLPFRLCFQKQDNKLVSFNIASDKNSSLFIAFQNGEIGKLNLKDSQFLWLSSLGGEIISDLIFEDGRIFLVTRLSVELPEENNKDSNNKDSSEKRKTNYILWALNAETGITDWQTPFASNTSVFLTGYRDKIFLVSKDGIINSIRKKDGQKVLKKNLLQEVSTPPRFFENKIYIGTGDNFILTLSANDGEIISKTPTIQSPATILSATADRLVWGESKGFVNFLDTKSNNRVWSVRYGGEISSLTLVQGGILVSSLDNFVYLISTQKGRRIWKKRLAGRILVEPLILGNFAVFVTSAAGNAVILDLRNGKIVNQIFFADVGYVTSKPIIVRKSLVFSTNKGIFAFADAKTNCSEN